MTQTALTREQVLKATGTVLDVMVAVHIFKEPVAPLYLPMILRDKRYCFIPDYSTDISDAWEVGEWFAETGIRGRYAKRLKEVILADKGECSTFDMVHASPADRCKAALLAVLDL